jgi:hypothetical protein
MKSPRCLSGGRRRRKRDESKAKQRTKRKKKERDGSTANVAEGCCQWLGAGRSSYSELEHSVVELLAPRVDLLDCLLRRRRYVRGVLDIEVLFDKRSHIGVVKVCFGIWTRKSPQHTRHSVIAVARGVVEVIESPASKLLSIVDWER